MLNYDFSHTLLEWCTAVANLNDPETYPLLRNYFIEGPNGNTTYNSIKHLPIEDMPGAVAEAWERCKYGDSFGVYQMAIIALEYGHIDALAVLIETLTSGTKKPYHDHVIRDIRPALLMHVDFRGSNEELAQWFEKNRDNLRFDKEAKKFVVDTPVEPQE